MYRFLLTPRWLGAAVLTVAASVVMVMLGNWQLSRYQERSAINDRIDAADSGAAVPLASVLPAPTAAGTAGAAPGKSLAWTKVTVSGRYDPAHEIQARGRTVDGDVGFEIVTPLVLTDGTAVLVDRGWVPAPPGGATAAPSVPPAPGGQVTVIGQVHMSESRPAPVGRRDGRLDTRRISLSRLAPEMPYPVYGAYLLLTSQTPPADEAFKQVPIAHEDAWQNGGYSVQWWLFAVMTLVAFGWQARKEATGGSPAGKRPAGGPRPGTPPRRPPSGDRVEEADRRRAAAASHATVTDRTEVTVRAHAAAAANHTTAANRTDVTDPAHTAATANHTTAANRTDRPHAASGDRIDDADHTSTARKTAG